MGKEKKIGLGIIGVLLLVFCVVLYQRIWGGDPLPPAAIPQAGPPATEENKDRSPPPQATVIQARGGIHADGDPTKAGWVKVSDANSKDSASATSGQRTSFMPKPIRSDEYENRSNDRSNDRFGAGRFREDDPQPAGRQGTIDRSGGDAFDPFSSRRGGSREEDRLSDGSDGRLQPADDARLRPSPEAIRTGVHTGGHTVVDQNPLRVRPRSVTGERPATSQPAVFGADDLDRRGQPDSRFASADDASPYQAQPARPSTALDGGLDEPAAAVGQLASGAVAGPPSGARGDGTYVVQPNDSFHEIAHKVYGNSGFFQALVEHNRKKFPDPSTLRVGDVVLTPEVSELRKNYPVFCPKQRGEKNTYYRAAAVKMAKSRGGRVYTVQQGDTLFDIAEGELGRRDRAWDIYRLNQDLLGEDFDYLKPGWQLILPGEGTPPATTKPAERLTREPRPTFRR